MDVSLTHKDEKLQVYFSTIEIRQDSKYFVNQLFLGGIFPLGLASMIYILFRSESLIIFELFKKLNVFNTIAQIRGNPIITNIQLPEWFLYALPDGLYAFSFTSLILLFWGNRISDKSQIWIYLIPIMAIASEFLQYFGWFPGTYDTADLMFYVIGFIFPFCLFRKELRSSLSIPKTSFISIVLTIIFLFLALIAGNKALF